MADIKDLLGEELYNSVQEKLGDKKLIINDGNYLPREEVNDAKKALTQELETLKTQFKDNEELTKQLETLMNKDKEWETKYKRIEFETKVKLLANKEGANDEEDVLKFISSDEDLDTQFKNLKEKKPYLFKITDNKNENKNDTTGFNPANNPLNVTKATQLQEQYNDAIKIGNTALAISISRELFKLKK